MTFPTLAVEIAFASEPLDTTPTFADVTGQTFAVTTKIGRPTEYTAFDPGVATVVLDNTDRDFDPLHTTGPYADELLPNKKVRIRATYDGTTYDLFTGHVDGWPQRYDEAWTSTMVLTVPDTLKLLRNAKLPQDLYAAEVLTDTPRLWYRMDETSGRTLLDSSGNGRHAYAQADASNVTTEGLMPCSSNGGIDLDSAQWDARIPREHLAFDYDPCTVEFWFRAQKPPSGGYVGVICSSAGEAGLYTEILISYEDPGVSNGGYLSFGVQQWLGGYKIAGGAPFICDGLAHHVACTRSGSTLKVYIDGVDVTSASISFGSLTATVGSPLEINVNYLTGTYEKWEGAQTPQLDEFAIYDTALSAARVLAHYQAGALLWDGDRTGERVDNILTAVGWPSALANTDTGQAILGPATWTEGTNALDYLRLVEATEQGHLYCDHADAGKVRFRSRSDILSATRSLNNQGVFSDNDGDEGTVVRYTTLDLDFDTVNIINTVEVAWVGGTVTSTDATSVAAYGEQATRIDTLCTTKAEAEALGHWVLTNYKDAFTRIRSVTINAAAQQGTSAGLAWTQVLEREIGDRILIVRHPQNLGAEVEQAVIIEGIEHTIGAEGPDGGINTWTTTFRCLPAPAVDYWILGTSELGTGTRLAF